MVYIPCLFEGVYVLMSLIPNLLLCLQHNLRIFIAHFDWLIEDNQVKCANL